METNYISRDTYGMYRNTEGGPGPALMGADTLIGNDVYNSADEKLGSIKELMIEMATEKSPMLYWRMAGSSVWVIGCSRFPGRHCSLTLLTSVSR